MLDTHTRSMTIFFFLLLGNCFSSWGETSLTEEQVCNIFVQFNNTPASKPRRTDDSILLCHVRLSILSPLNDSLGMRWKNSILHPLGDYFEWMWFPKYAAKTGSYVILQIPRSMALITMKLLPQSSTLLMAGIHEVRHWDGFKRTDKRTRLQEDW